MLRLFAAALMVLGIAVFSLNTAPPVPAQASANALYISQSCTDTASVSFTWQGSDPSAQQVWIDLSIFDNGFAPRSFIGAGPFNGSDTFYTWNGLKPGTTHYVRINQQLANGRWDASSDWMFTTCGATAVSAPPPTPKPPAQSVNQAWLGCWKGTYSPGGIQGTFNFTTATATQLSGTYSGITSDGRNLGSAVQSYRAQTNGSYSGTGSSATESLRISPDGQFIEVTRTATVSGDIFTATLKRC